VLSIQQAGFGSEQQATAGNSSSRLKAGVGVGVKDL